MKTIKKITKLSELKKLDKTQLLSEMMKGTIKGGSSCGATPPFSVGSGGELTFSGLTIDIDESTNN